MHVAVGEEGKEGVNLSYVSGEAEHERCLFGSCFI